MTRLFILCEHTNNFLSFKSLHFSARRVLIWKSLWKSKIVFQHVWAYNSWTRFPFDVSAITLARLFTAFSMSMLIKNRWRCLWSIDSPLQLPHKLDTMEFHLDNPPTTEASVTAFSLRFFFTGKKSRLKTENETWNVYNNFNRCSNIKEGRKSE